MNIEIKKKLINRYFISAFKMFVQARDNGEDLDHYTIDHQDILKNSDTDFSQFKYISNYAIGIIDFLRDIFQDQTYAQELESGNIKLFNQNNLETNEFKFIITENLNFSGTIGIQDLEKDYGYEKHVDYLTLFLGPDIKNYLDFSFKPRFFGQLVDIDSQDINKIINAYKDLYTFLHNYLTNDMLSAYNILSKIREIYSFPRTGVILNSNESYRIINFNNLKSADFFINKSDLCTFEVSETSPMIKLLFNGEKILHIRTKEDSKNNKKKLRFFIETTSKMFTLFEENL